MDEKYSLLLIYSFAICITMFIGLVGLLNRMVEITQLQTIISNVG